MGADYAGVDLLAGKDGTVYVLEVNPRASRTVPFVSKAIGRPLISFFDASLHEQLAERLGVSRATLREVQRLARRNASLEIRLEELDRKRRKLKRRLGEVA